MHERDIDVADPRQSLVTPPLRSIAARLLSMSSAKVFSIAVALIAVLMVLDAATGPELAFSIFYLVPVALVAWHSDGQWALAVAGVSALAWLAADIAVRDASSILVPLWNGGVRLGVFVLFAKLIGSATTSVIGQHRLARTDAITGLSNARGFEEAAQRDLAMNRRHRRPVSLAYIDLDQFKRVNDEQGHAAGDAVLRAVAGHLMETCRSSDIVARMGGDEFAVLLPEADAEGALAVTTRMHVGTPGGITMSVGVVTGVPPPMSLEPLLTHADRLMYQAKERGKNQTVHEVVAFA